MADSNGPAVTIKHWRTFGQAEWDHVAEGSKGLALGSLVPVVLFYSSLRFWSLTAAIAIVLAWSAGVFIWHRRRTGAADIFSAVTFCFACFQAAIGFLSQDTTIYLAVPSIENIIYGLVFLGSALIGRPILALYAKRLYPIPPVVQQTQPFQRALLVVSAAWFVGLLVRSLVRLWLLVNLPLEWYLVLNTVAGWPFNIALITFTVWYPLRVLTRAGLITTVPEIENIEEAIEEAIPGSP